MNGKYARRIEDRDIFKWTGKIIRSQERLNIGIVGNSHVMDAVDPDIINAENSRTTYNLAVYHIPLPNMIELLHKYDFFPEVIFIDVSTRYAMYNRNERFLDKLSRSKYDHNRERLLDRLAFFFPSLFVPPKFKFLFKRATQSIIEFIKLGYPLIGRYTPFKLFVGFDWSLAKHTNHRAVIRRKRKSKLEKIAELRALRISINESRQNCNNSNPDYHLGFEILERYVSDAISKGSNIIFFRLPLDQRLIHYEDTSLGFYFDDIKALSRRFNLEYFDFNLETKYPQLRPFSFYIDGQHLEHSSAIKISQLISSLIKQYDKSVLYPS